MILALGTHLIYNPLPSETYVPQTKTHITIETKVHPPAHPADILQLVIHAEAQTGEGNRARTGEVVKIALLVLHCRWLAGAPRGVIALRARETFERAVVESLYERVQ